MLLSGLKNKLVEKGGQAITDHGPAVKVIWSIGGIWLFNILVALDQLVNSLLWGDPDQTISSRAGKARVEGKCWGCCLCRLLDWVDNRHCHKSLEYDEGGKSVLATWRREKAAARKKKGAS